MSAFSRPVLSAALFFGLRSAAHAACPWANGTYKGQVPVDIEVTVTFNAECTSATLTDSGTAPVKLAVVDTGKGWRVNYDTTSLIFQTNGKRAVARRGGAQRTVRFRKR